jgi:hypothetical protein
VKAKVVELYGLKSLEFEAVFGGPEPQFGESQRKQAAAPLNRAKKGQFTLDSWIKVPPAIVLRSLLQVAVLSVLWNRNRNRWK